MPSPYMNRLISGAVDIAAERERGETPSEMTYSTSWPEIVTTKQAQREIKNHGVLWSDFIADYGVRDTYQSDDVLGWLGY